jgi:AcrR family transcriptional regulator
MATVYRRFPTRDDLIECVFMQQLSAYVEIMNDALAHPDGWEGFRSCLEAICLMQAENRGFTDIMTTFAPRSVAMRADHARAEALMSQVVKRARATGRLRPDFRLEDIPLLLHANLGVVSAGRNRPDASPRLVAYLLQAFEARNSDPLPRLVAAAAADVLAADALAADG